MHRYLLDTNIVSFVLNDKHPSVRLCLAKTNHYEIALPSVVEAELRYGAARLPASARIHAALDRFLEGLDILPWTSACAQTYAKLRVEVERQGKPMGLADMMIAAHALALDLVLVTSDKDFQSVEHLRLEDWTQGPHPA